MTDPRHVLRTLVEHWVLLEPLCERFDADTLSPAELRNQLNTQLPESSPAEVTALFDQWIRLDILVPVAKSPNRFELNAQIHDSLAYLRHEHRLGLRPEIEVYLRHLERFAGYIQDTFETRDNQDLARQLRPLDMRVHDVLKKPGNDEQVSISVAGRVRTSDRQIPLAQRYAEVLTTRDECIELVTQLASAGGAFEQGVRWVEQVPLRLLGEQQRPGHLVDDDLVLRTHARILEMQTNAQLTSCRARELLLLLREEARRHNAVTRGVALALAAIRRKDLDVVPQVATSLFIRPRSTFLGAALQVESYVLVLARFEPKPAQSPKSSGTRKSDGSVRPPQTMWEMIECYQAVLPLLDLMQWLLAREPDDATDELLYWFSRLSRDARFQHEHLQRREYETTKHCVSLCSFALNPAAKDKGQVRDADTPPVSETHAS